MHGIPRRAFLAAFAVTLVSAATVPAAERSSNTVMTVSEMCGGCVKRITGKLETLQGVASIQCDVKTKTVTVVPESGETLSARTLWEAMEEISKTPRKLVGPSGTFTSKPRS
jgi:mercuric ion binding protein